PQLFKQPFIAFDFTSPMFFGSLARFDIERLCQRNRFSFTQGRPSSLRELQGREFSRRGGDESQAQELATDREPRTALHIATDSVSRELMVAPLFDRFCFGAGQNIDNVIQSE